MGKTAAATTTAQLILEHDIEKIIFTGVAGALDPELNIGDIVVAKNLYHHDMDVSPIYQKYEIPLLNTKCLQTDEQLRKQAIEAADNFLKNELSSSTGAEDLRKFNISIPKVVEADIASGDKFVAERSERDQIKTGLPSVVCVEMEGAAVAQVCYEYQIPLTVIRVISDSADEKAEIDFPGFIKDVASKYSHGILKNIYDYQD
jgi:adenosylhomocysteine nucleosidase